MEQLMPLLSTKKVAAIFEVTEYTVRQWIKDGKLPATKVGKSWRVQESAVRDLVNDKYGSENTK